MCGTRDGVSRAAPREVLNYLGQTPEGSLEKLRPVGDPRDNKMCRTAPERGVSVPMDELLGHWSTKMRKWRN